MIKTSLVHAARYLLRNKAFSIFNIAGMAIAITCSLVIYFYASYEYSYDKFFADSDRIYRLVGVDDSTGEDVFYGLSTNALGGVAAEQIPEVESACRMRIQGRGLFIHDQQRYTANRTAIVESSCFDVFDFQLIYGNREQLLTEPYSAVVTESFARRIFGDKNPVGETISIDGQNRDLAIAGVVKDYPENTHLKLDVMFSAVADQANQEAFSAWLNSWLGVNMTSYVKLFEGSDESAVNKKIDEIMGEYEISGTFSAVLQPLRDIHLGSSHLISDPFTGGRGNKENVNILLLVASFLLILAGFNFMNLSIAKATSRSRDVAMRKVSGASRLQLVWQYTLEAFLLVFPAALVSLAMVELLQPWIDLPLTHGAFSYIFSNILTAVIIISVLTILSLFVGAYPALLLSSLNTVSMLKGEPAFAAKGHPLQKILVVIQFTISISMIIGVLIVGDQLTFMKNKPLGYDKNGVILIGLGDAGLWSTFGQLQEELENIPEVKSITTATLIPGYGQPRKSFWVPGDPSNREWLIGWMNISETYFDTLGMTLKQGRNFSPDFGNDATNSIIVNESAVRSFGWEEPIGESLRMRDGSAWTVVGVVKDFHVYDAHQEIGPMVMFWQDQVNRPLTLAIKVDETNIGTAISKIETAWNAVNPSRVFEYTLLSESLDRLYSSEKELNSVLIQFSSFVIGLACLGLYALTTFSLSKKAAQIAIRKVLGASAARIILMVTKEYFYLIVCANLLAWPIAWYLMSNWLSDFAYRVDLSWVNFLLASGMLAILTFIVVAFGSAKVATSKPIHALRTE